MSCFRIGIIVPVPTMLFDGNFVCSSKRANSFASCSGFWRSFVKEPVRPLSEWGCCSDFLVFVLINDAVGGMKRDRLSLILLGRRS